MTEEELATKIDDLRCELREWAHSVQSESACQLEAVTRALYLHYRQLEALVSVVSSLAIRHPLPPMRGWSISPDFARTLVGFIFGHKPKLILELGSGVSTLIAAYALRRTGNGHIISIEHHPAIRCRSLSWIRLHELQGLVTILLSDLRPSTINDQNWLWYDTAFLTDGKMSCIDMLVVDGPPGDTQKYARYPALPLLAERLSDRAVILIDDADREDEREIVRRWLNEFPGFEITMVDDEKGTAIMRKRPQRKNLRQRRSWLGWR